ncbi:MAG: hypothetical protein ACREBU_08480 [Nitrososphaera sp.]
MTSDKNQLSHISLLEEVLQVLGSENLPVLYHHLERLGVKKNEIADKPEEFSKALKSIFGQGAAILESQIVSSISSKVGLDYGTNMTLSQVLSKLK